MTKRKQPITEFNTDEIEDVRILIKVKGKHFSVIPNRDVVSYEQAIQVRKVMLEMILPYHFIVSTALEDIKS